MEEKLTVTMTLDQAVAITRMLDLATRINLCQFSEIAHCANTRDIKHETGRGLTFDEIDSLSIYCNKINNVFGFSATASFGIGSKHVSKDAKRAFELKKVIERAIAMYRNPNPSFIGVDYDGLGPRLTNDPAPTAEIKP